MLGVMNVKVGSKEIVGKQGEDGTNETGQQLVVKNENADEMGG